MDSPINDEELAELDRLLSDLTDEPGSKVALPISLPKAEVSEITPAGYRFPFDHPDFALKRSSLNPQPTERLLRLLKDTSTSLGKPLGPQEYAKHRVLACTLSIILNEKRRMPPCLRSYWRIGSKPTATWSAEETLLANDLRVIDLHWAYVNKLSTGGEHWSHIFADTFDFEAASDFASTKRYAKNKAMELGLAETQMLALSIIRTDKVRERQRTINGMLIQARSKISEAISKPRSRMSTSIEELLAVSQALLYTDFNMKQAPVMFDQITGRGITEQAIRRHSKWLQDNKVISPSKSS